MQEHSLRQAAPRGKAREVPEKTGPGAEADTGCLVVRSAICLLRERLSVKSASSCLCRKARATSCSNKARGAGLMAATPTHSARHLSQGQSHSPGRHVVRKRCVNLKPGKEMATPRTAFPLCYTTECRDIHGHTCRKHPCHMTSRCCRRVEDTGLLSLTTVHSLNHNT